MTLAVHVDASSRDPLKWSGIGAVAFLNGEPVASMSASILPSWSHASEAEAVLHGLRLAAALGAQTVTVYTDAEGLPAALQAAGGTPWARAFREQWERHSAPFTRCSVVWRPRAGNPAHRLARCGRPREVVR